MRLKVFFNFFQMLRSIFPKFPTLLVFIHHAPLILPNHVPLIFPHHAPLIYPSCPHTSSCWMEMWEGSFRLLLMLRVSLPVDSDSLVSSHSSSPSPTAILSDISLTDCLRSNNCSNWRIFWIMTKIPQVRTSAWNQNSIFNNQIYSSIKLGI